MKKSIVAGSIGLGLLALAGTANALTFNEAQNSTFDQYLNVTPSVTNTLVFSVSGLNSQFDALSFSFLAVPGLIKTATLSNGVWKAAFNDNLNGLFTLTGGTTYSVKVSGHTLASIPGGSGTVTVSALNAVVTAVPEPESYAMLLAGLGLIGVVARRRKQRPD